MGELGQGALRAEPAGSGMAQNYGLGFQRPRGMRILMPDEVVQVGDWIYRLGGGWSEVLAGTVFVGARVGAASAARACERAAALDKKPQTEGFRGVRKTTWGVPRRGINN